MRTEQILKVLKNERECIKRQSGVEAPDGSVGICDRNCANCSLVLPDTEILEVYDFLINGYELLQNEGAEAYSIRYDVSKEEAEELIAKLRAEPMRAVRCDPAEIEFTPLPNNFRVVKGDTD